MTKGTARYHRDVYLPEAAKGLCFAALLRHSHHARQEAKNDRHGPFDLPQVFDSRKADLFEVTMEAGRVVIGAFRQDYDDAHDMVLIINLVTSTLITAWLNRKDDQHQTLKQEVYATE